MSSSVMTTCRQSSATGSQIEESPSTSLPLTGTSILAGARELQELEASSGLDNTYPPRPIDYRPSVNGRRSTRFTLHRLLSAAIPIVFVASKFIDSFHGRALTLDLLDLVPAVLVLILNVFSWFEYDPPPYYLGWLLDTDWDYLLAVAKQGTSSILFLVKDLAQRVKKNPSTSLGIIFGAFSVLPGITRAILLSRHHHPGGYLVSFGMECIMLVLNIIPASLVVMDGDQRQRNAYELVFMSAILTQPAILASWIMDSWFSNRTRISSILLLSRDCLLLITIALGWSTAHWEKPMQSTLALLALLSSISVCILIISGGIIQGMNPGDLNIRRNLTIAVGLCAYGVFGLGSVMFVSWKGLRRYRPHAP